jgi:protein O-mannosyl-transferase
MIALTAIWAYAPSFAGALVFDDLPSIAQNPNLRELWPLTRSMSAPAETTTSGRPVASLTFALNHALAPPDVRDVFTAGGRGAPPAVAARARQNLWGYHAVNLAIHVMAAWVLFGVVRRTASTAPSGFALALSVALIWAVHPLTTNAVTYVVQRVESLMSLFLLLTLYCAIRAHDSPRRAWWIAGSIAACALGMATKQSMVVAPILVVLWDWVFRARAESPWPRARTGLYLGLFSTWILLAALVIAEPRAHSVGFHLGWTWWSYLVTQSQVVLHYLRLAIWPAPLVFDYDWTAVTSFAGAWWSMLAVGVLVVATIVGVVRRSAVAFPGAWFFLILAPSSSVLPIVTEIAAEQRMYLPLAAVVALAVMLGARWSTHLPARARKGVSGLAVAAVVLALGASTRARNADYRSEVEIWRDTVAKRPGNVRARVAYGKALYLEGRSSEAAAALRAAIAIDDRDPMAHVNLGAALASMQRFDEAIPELERALTLDPRVEGGAANLGEAYAAMGKFDKAVNAFGVAVSQTPDSPFLLNRLGWILATSPEAALRDGSRAVALAERAVQLTGRRDPISLDTLAAALAETARFDDAIAAGEEARRLAALTGRPELIPELDDRLARYRAKQPFRQPR